LQQKTGLLLHVAVFTNLLFSKQHLRTKSKFILFLIGSLACFFSSYAQDSRPYRNYATQKVHQSLLAHHPEFAPNLQSIESLIKGYGNAGDGRKDTIPVVFHILYAPGQPYPDEAQIQAQIDALNRDFEKYTPPVETYTFDKIQDMANTAVDPEIFFCLPNYDAGGNTAKPIEYIETSVTEWANDDAIKSVESGGANAWEPGLYMNVWVGMLNQDGKAGYAQLPGGPVATDGIVIDTRYFGTGMGDISTWYNSSKTLTHLTGTYLGLYELWNEINPCADDHVSDTPIHNEPNYGIGTNYHHLSLCDSTLQIEMVINFMDNTDDIALTMFTPGQKSRMKAVLSADGWRSHLPTGSVQCSGDGFQALEDRNNGNKSLSPAFRLFPNPAISILNLEIFAANGGKVQFSASNTLGERIWFSECNTGREAQLFRADCSSWPAGEYYIQAVFESGAVISRKVYIEKP
jgi:hypothetical protein